MPHFNKKSIEHIVWFIPFGKVRNSVRQFFYYVLEKLYLIAVQNKRIIEKLENKNKTDDNFIVVTMCCGFADQIHHYICGLALEILYNKKVKYDIEWYATGTKNRDFVLKKLFPDIPIATYEEAVYHKFHFDYGSHNGRFASFEDYIINNENAYLYDYESWPKNLKKYNPDGEKKVFEKIDLSERIFSQLDKTNLDCVQRINKTEASVAVHVRRGDYSDIAVDRNYFLKAIDALRKKIGDDKKIKLFFFSDNMKWIKRKLIGSLSKNIAYELLSHNDQNHGYIDLYLMSCCKYQIASIGHFCATAFLFNKHKDKILVTPKNIEDIIAEKNA